MWQYVRCALKGRRERRGARRRLCLSWVHEKALFRGRFRGRHRGRHKAAFSSPAVRTPASSISSAPSPMAVGSRAACPAARCARRSALASIRTCWALIRSKSACRTDPLSPARPLEPLRGHGRGEPPRRTGTRMAARVLASQSRCGGDRVLLVSCGRRGRRQLRASCRREACAWHARRRTTQIRSNASRRHCTTGKQ